MLKPAHGFAVTMITILLVVCAAYEKTAEAARSEFYIIRSQMSKMLNSRGSKGFRDPRDEGFRASRETS